MNCKQKSSKSKSRKSKSRSKSKKKDDNRLKRPMNPYMLFSRDEREKNEKRGGDKLSAKELSKRWAKLSASKKKKYEDEFDQNLEEYKQKKKELEDKSDESESDSEEIKLDNSSYKNTERVSTLSSSSQ